ncbi:protein kinase [Promethearchaeum syntrophicum]|uniref:Protein kinase n=1 Tax=Promethearchaeum syntrophicum TaxID=2594042 RepID=A0A5B9DEP6_9ARCH|nr:protein kinase [Candidatus Prometheoarchaeum syntrophicum]QEE17505.1 serine/threonine-protein kinase [Candidatus Prometheoarchaeum syntrophicum]
MSTNSNFFQCSKCKSIFLIEPESSKSCKNCGKKNLDPIDGRFILRCKKCGLTQNKPAFSKLHSEKALKCQSSTCKGAIKLIQLRKRSTLSTPIAIQPKQPPSPKIDIGKSIIKTLKEVHPPVPKRRELPKKPFVNNYKPFPSDDVSKDKIDEETFMPFPSSAPKPKVKSLPTVSQIKNHPGIQIGDRLKLNEDMYEITAKIGIGGMGAVHLARNIKTKKMVALKEFFYTRYHDPESGSNFCNKYWVRESEITEIQSKSPETSMHLLGSLILEQFPIPEYYIFLEYIDGIALDKWYTDRYKNIDQLNGKELRMLIKDILMPIARHMYYVHQQGIVHRDLTVQNTIILNKRFSDKYTPVIIDWGVAKEVGIDNMFKPRKPYYVTSAPEATGIRNRGTPPEIMAGFEPIAASDIYMFGHMMFYLFSGGHYASAAATNEDFVLHPGDYNPDLPPEFTRLVEFCTQYEPADRMENMVKVYDALNWLYDASLGKHKHGIDENQSQLFLFCDYNNGLIPLYSKKVIKIGRDEVIAAGKNHDMDGHLHSALIPTSEGKFSFELYVEGNYVYIRDNFSKLGSFISNLTSTNQQVYNNVPIKGLDNVVIQLSDSNIGKTSIEVPFVAPDGKTYRITFKIVKKK